MCRPEIINLWPFYLTLRAGFDVVIQEEARHNHHSARLLHSGLLLYIICRKEAEEESGKRQAFPGSIKCTFYYTSDHFLLSFLWTFY